jgi:predicted phosphodiesterase
MKIAFISDIHEDIVSLRIALSNIEKLACDKIVCLGDICGYSPFYYKYHNERNAHECLSIIKQNCEIIISGNHDYFASESLPELSPNFNFPENWYELDYFQKQSIANSKLWDYESSELNPKISYQDKEFLAGLKQFQSLKSENAEILLSHYIYPNLSGMESNYCKNISDYQKHFDFMLKQNSKISIVGHAHPSKLYYISKKQINKKNFGKSFEIDTEMIILCPAIARGSFKQAFLVFDSNDNRFYAKRI